MASNAHRSVLLMGGAPSGKNSFADSCGRAFSRVIYFATAHHSMGGDGEMDERIAKHVARRSKDWKTMEPPATIDDLLNTALIEKPDAVIVDCATLWLGWELSRVYKQYTKTQISAHMENEMTHFVDTLKKLPCPVFVVSNETGCGVVPEHASGRLFRGCQGILNSLLAAQSPFVVMFFAGQGLFVRDATAQNAQGYLPIATVTPAWVTSHLS
jgi:adenosylcobinamide kinase/adenosylcobinamide-phosphate guanylyltransferase